MIFSNKVSHAFRVLALTVSLCAFGISLAAAQTPPEQLFVDAFDLLKNARLEESAAKFEEGLRAQPNNAMAHFYAGEAYFGLRKSDMARAHYQSALKLEPNANWAADAKKRLAELAKPSTPPQTAKALTPGTEFKDCENCPAMIVIPSGKFVMGSPPSEPRRFDNEGPVHIVTIGQSLAAGKYEITRAEFGRFARATSRQMKGCYYFDGKQGVVVPAQSWENPGFPQGDNEPAVCVSWEDAQAYVKWLSQQSGKTYRLLSEAEWEYAARAGSQEPYSWGHDENQACQFANVYDLTGKQKHGFPWPNFNCTDRHAYTAPVGSFKPNAFGLYDMLGNAWEWVEDCSNDSYSGAPADGIVWTAGNCSRRVLRGGGWFSEPRLVRSANRYGNTPAYRIISLGFRLARTLP